MIISEDKQLVVYNDDYKPVNVYSGRKKIAGYKEEEYNGKHIEVEDTYNDALDVRVQGHHEQDSRKAYWWNQLFNVDSLISTKNIVVNNTALTMSNGDGTKYYYNINSNLKEKLLPNHKYYYLFNCTEYNVSFGRMKLLISSNKIASITLHLGVIYGTFIVAENANIGNNLTFSTEIVTGYIIDTDIVSIKDLIIVDLTAMFGEGKEPTAEQFRKMFPCDYYPYCEGEWRYANGGQYVNFNQKVKGNFSDSSIIKNVWIAYPNCNIKIENNICIISSGNPNAAKRIQLSDSYSNKLNNGNKFLILYDIKKLVDENLITSVFIGMWTAQITYNKEWTTIGVFCNIASDISSKIGIAFDRTNQIYDGRDVCAINNIMFIDLTQMFGEGNEPTTVEEFKALYPNEYYDYVESRYEYTPGYYEDGQVVEHIPDTAFDTPFPEMPEEVRVLSNSKVNVSSKGVVWNQLATIQSFKSDHGLTVTKLNDYSIKIKGFITEIFTTNTTAICIYNISNIVPNHKYYIKCTPIGNSTGLSFRVYNYFNDLISKDSILIANDTYPTQGNYSNVRIYGTISNKEIDCIIYFNAFDLTEMFGAGNEPQTVEEFRAMFPKDYYPYDPGTLRTIKGLHPIIPKDYTIPFELYGANGVNDEVEPCVFVNGEWKCRVTRRWWKCRINDFSAIYSQTNSADNKRFQLINSGIYTITNAITAIDRKNSIISDIYVYGSGPIMQNTNNYEMSTYRESNSIYLNDTDCETVEELKTKRKNNYIIYKLETPIIELYPPIPIRTLPINTIIDSDAELDCNIKTIDKI